MTERASGAEALATWLRQPQVALTRLEVQYVRRRSFRWLVLLEITLVLLVLVVCFVPLVLGVGLLLLLSEGDFQLDLPGMSPRFFAFWQEISITGVDRDGNALLEWVHAPDSLAERDRIMAQVLAVASRTNVVVHETLRATTPEPLETWYGGQPLLAHPDQRDLAASLSALEQLGWQIEQGDDRVRLHRVSPFTSRGWGLFGLVTGVLLLPLALVGLEGSTNSLRKSWADLRGVPASRWTVEIDPAALRLEWSRGTQRENAVVLHASDLLGVAFSPSLGFGREVVRRPPSLTLVARDELVRSPLHLGPREGRALCDAIVGAAILVWEGIPTTLTRPSKCPYCGSLYTFTAAAPCPSCGGWPTTR